MTANPKTPPNPQLASTATTQASINRFDPDGSNRLPKLVNVLEAADFLAVSKRTLQQLTADRLVAVVKFGRNVRYDIADLRRFAESRKIREIGWKAASRSTSTSGGIQQ